jgi:hypothetical protein
MNSLINKDEYPDVEYPPEAYSLEFLHYKNFFMLEALHEILLGKMTV